MRVQGLSNEGEVMAVVMRLTVDFYQPRCPRWE